MLVLVMSTSPPRPYDRMMQLRALGRTAAWPARRRHAPWPLLRRLEFWLGGGMDRPLFLRAPPLKVRAGLLPILPALQVCQLRLLQGSEDDFRGFQAALLAALEPVRKGRRSVAQQA